MTAVRPGGRVFVSGASGFVGVHAVAELRAAGLEVVQIRAEEHDLTRAWPQLDSADGILHLAGLASVGPSFDQPQLYLEVNSSMVTNLGQALLERPERSPRVVIVSSGALYGASDAALTEDSPSHLTSPYAVSKAVIEDQCEYYRNRGLDIVVARPFNHIGPGQAGGFIVPDLAHRLRDLPPGGALSTGNLESSRDYTDVRDVVRAYRMLLERPVLNHALYNVASGTSRTGREVLTEVARALGVEVPPVEVAQSRGLDPDTIVADASRLRDELGWEPRMSFAQSISDFVASAGDVAR